jgi:hypothetical protein
MESDMYGLVEKIVRGVGFIAIGGTLAVMFFLLFAQSILGAKTIHKQLEKLLHQTEQISEQLKKMAQYFEARKDDPPKQ